MPPLAAAASPLVAPAAAAACCHCCHCRRRRHRRHRWDQQVYLVQKAEQERQAAVIRAEGEAEAAELISSALKTCGSGLIEVRFVCVSPPKLMLLLWR
jgi:hypothetical protein